MTKIIRTEKETYETIDGKNVKILRVFHNGIEKKKAIFPDLRKEEFNKKKTETERKNNAKNKKTKIQNVWKNATTTGEKIEIIGYVVGLNEKL